MKIFRTALVTLGMLGMLGSQPVMAYQDSLLNPYGDEGMQPRQRGQANTQPGQQGRERIRPRQQELDGTQPIQLRQESTPLRQPRGESIQPRQRAQESSEGRRESRESRRPSREHIPLEDKPWEQRKADDEAYGLKKKTQNEQFERKREKLRQAGDE
ncbi:MAG: hypothetical protein L0H12_00905, partial [Nitrosospira sp.]|nr:hypothetical protein [Nitrosospira sp.]